MDIPGLSTLYAILKRNIELKNDVVAQRKELAAELYQNCRKWTEILIETFDKASLDWARKGKDAALKEVEKQIDDFMKLDYWSLESNSPILRFLREDKRFETYARSCANFYLAALDLKRLVYGGIEDHPGHKVTLGDVGVQRMFQLWKEELEAMLQDVSMRHNEIRTITPA
jgi:hypothetical protein